MFKIYKKHYINTAPSLGLKVSAIVIEGY